MKEALILILFTGILVGTTVLILGLRELKKKSHEPK